MTSASSSTDTSTLRARQIRLKSLQSMFNDIYRFARTLTTEITDTEIKVRLEKIDDLCEKVNDAFLEVEIHEDFSFNDTVFSKQRSEFMERFYEAKSVMLKRMNELGDASVVNELNRVHDKVQQSTVKHVRLPQIRLPTFDGNWNEWLSFRNLYSTLIHTRTDLPDVEKFFYLKGSLSGEAKALIDPISITAANYIIAWETLIKRYDNSKLLKRRQVNSLLQLPSLTEESVTGLQSLMEDFERIVRTLDQLVQPEDYRELLLLNIISSRLDPLTRRGWEEHAALKDHDTILDMTEFLQRRVRMLNSLPCSSNVDSANKTIQRHSYKAAQSVWKRCVVCSKVHSIHLCPEFRSMTVSARDKLLRNHALCRNCFKRGHHSIECSSRSVCRTCGARHHTMVCFRSTTGLSYGKLNDNVSCSSLRTLQTNFERFNRKSKKYYYPRGWKQQVWKEVDKNDTSSSTQDVNVSKEGRRSSGLGDLRHTITKQKILHEARASSRDSMQRYKPNAFRERVVRGAWDRKWSQNYGNQLGCSSIWRNNGSRQHGCSDNVKYGNDTKGRRECYQCGHTWVQNIGQRGRLKGKQPNACHGIHVE